MFIIIIGCLGEFLFFLSFELSCLKYMLYLYFILRGIEEKRSKRNFIFVQKLEYMEFIFKVGFDQQILCVCIMLLVIFILYLGDDDLVVRVG